MATELDKCGEVLEWALREVFEPTEAEGKVLAVMDLLAQRRAAEAAAAYFRDVADLEEYAHIYISPALRRRISQAQRREEEEAARLTARLRGEE